MVYIRAFELGNEQVRTKWGGIRAVQIKSFNLGKENGRTKLGGFEVLVLNRNVNDYGLSRGTTRPVRESGGGSLAAPCSKPWCKLDLL